MAEAIVISIFLVLLVLMQLKEQRTIKIYTRFSKVRAFLALGLAVIIAVIFWPQTSADQIKLIVFAILIASFGFMREGLAEKRLVKLGLLEGKLSIYQTIQLEKLDSGDTFVTFYRRKNNSFSMIFGESIAKLSTYFKQAGLSERLVIGALPEEPAKPIAKRPSKKQLKRAH